MKLISAFLTACAIFVIANARVQAVPLNGNYTVGSGGAYPTIGDAVRSVDSLGVSGPVSFKILNGVYNEFNILQHITGASLVNTVTFESSSGNPDDVTINATPITFRLQGATCIFIKNLTLGNIELRGLNHIINITNNKFINTGITQTFGESTLELSILNNSGLSGIIISSMGILSTNVNIVGNSFNSPNGFMEISNCHTLLIEDNTLNHLGLRFCDNIRLVRNTVEFNDSTSGGFEVSFCKSGAVINNFAIDRTGAHNVTFRNDSALFIDHNTFRSEVTTLDTTVSIFDDYGSHFRNNIVNNPGGHFVMSLNNNQNYSSSFNVYWNGNTQNLISYNGTAYNNIASFQAATGLDNGSIQREIFFVSETDMHLAGPSIGDELLMTDPDPLVPVDIDGQPRGLHPYRGADEADIPLPVELSSFTSVVQNNNVTLLWETSSETNNYGFEIERTNDATWNKIGFVRGNGTQSGAQYYSFKDNSLSSGKYNYRLKQIDINGNYQYHNLINDVVIGLPSTYELSQNFPNPFNPATNIKYSLPSDGKVTLKIFDTRGREVALLLNDIKTAGYYSVNFNASNLSSGIYYYMLTSGSFSETKKMILVK